MLLLYTDTSVVWTVKLHRLKNNNLPSPPPRERTANIAHYAFISENVSSFWHFFCTCVGYVKKALHYNYSTNKQTKNKTFEVRTDKNRVSVFSYRHLFLRHGWLFTILSSLSGIEHGCQYCLSSATCSEAWHIAMITTLIGAVQIIFMKTRRFEKQVNKTVPFDQYTRINITTFDNQFISCDKTSS